VFLTEDVWSQWLDPRPVEAQDEKQELLAMIDRASLVVAHTIRTHPVSKRVNNVRDTSVAKDDPTLIAPITLSA
jgi:putative SOS response-associated peptidase YedK